MTEALDGKFGCMMHDCTALGCKSFILFSQNLWERLPYMNQSVNLEMDCVRVSIQNIFGLHIVGSVSPDFQTSFFTLDVCSVS